MPPPPPPPPPQGKPPPMEFTEYVFKQYASIQHNEQVRISYL